MGADGAKSTVRKKLQIPFEGTTFNKEMYLSDFKFVNPTDDFHVEARIWRDMTLAMIPVTRDVIRLISNSPNYVDLAPKNLQLGEEIWKSNFRVNHRLAAKFQEGNVVFLAGDAAHIHSPVGGRGMNIGFEDVFVLISLLKKNQLQRYSELRRPILQKMVGQIDFATEMFLGEKTTLRPLIPYFLPTLRALFSGTVNRFVLGLNHELGV